MANETPYLVDFDLETIKMLGGGVVFKQVQRLIQAAVDDCEARAAEPRPRKVMIFIEISPKTREDSDFDENTTRILADGLELCIKLDSKMPNRKSMTFDCGIGKGGKILFNPHNPSNHRQIPLPIILDQKSQAAGG